MRFWNDKEYTNEEGAVVIERQFFETDTTDTINVFIAKGATIIRTPMGDIPKDFEVFLDADSIEEAFLVFEEQMNEKAEDAANAAAAEVIQDLKEQMMEKQSSIITPDKMINSSNISF